ncbi:hypothetical protein PC111_g15356 [Phytophthora cactorum]|nr:hypothetical protein PC111_g15356 [Phytophthora cactorum]
MEELLPAPEATTKDRPTNTTMNFWIRVESSELTQESARECSLSILAACQEANAQWQQQGGSLLPVGPTNY